MDLSTVITQHRTYVRALLTRHGVDAAQLDDAEQEVFVVLVRRCDAYDPHYSHRQWLAGISRRVAAAFRRRQRRDAIGVGTTVSAPPPPEDVLLARQLVGRLDHSHRTIWLSGQAGHTAAEIAEQLRLPITTVQWRLRVARRKLREAVRQLGQLGCMLTTNLGGILARVARTSTTTVMTLAPALAIAILPPTASADRARGRTESQMIASTSASVSGLAHRRVQRPPFVLARVRLGEPTFVGCEMPSPPSIDLRPHRHVPRARPVTPIVLEGDPTIVAFAPSE